MTPAVVILLKAPRPGLVKTRLAATAGDHAAAGIFRQMVERQLRVVPAVWPVTVHYAPADAGPEMRQWLDPVRPGLDFLAQGTGDLGAQLSAAFQAEFGQGATRVIAIGGDCPALDGEILQAALDKLESTDAVLGPAKDGGYYLIGLKAPCPALFTGIAWSTPIVLMQTRERIHAAGLTVTELPQLEDVDDAASWRRALAAGVFAGQPETPDRAALLLT